jgi:uncharacterized protein YidB (DUF937 family)
MGFLSGVLGGVVGAEMLTVVEGVLDKHGGVAGVVSQFEKQGLGATVKSWVGTGPNQPISPDQVQQALGADSVSQLAAKAGVGVKDLLSKLSTALPQAIDKLTPSGTVPKA